MTMIETGTNKKILYLIIIILAITNITTVATIFFHSNREKKINEMPPFERKNFDREKAGEFLKKELNLNEKQAKEFRYYGEIHHAKTEKIFSGIDSMRIQYSDELGKENPDTLKLKEITDKMGSLHAEMKYISCKHYLQTKEICTQEQKIKLHKIFNEKIKPCKPHNCKMKQ